MKVSFIKTIDYNNVRAHFHVGANMPGYLPESDVYCAETITEALEAMLGEVDRLQDLMAENCTAPDMETQEKGSDCCGWCSSYWSIEAIKSAYSDGDLQFRTHRALTEHQKHDGKSLGTVWSYHHSDPGGPDVVHWITVHADEQEKCLLWRDQYDMDEPSTPHNETQSIVDHMERDTYDSDPHDYDGGGPDDDYDYDDVEDDGSGCEVETLHEDNGDGTETESY